MSLRNCQSRTRGGSPACPQGQGRRRADALSHPIRWHMGGPGGGECTVDAVTLPFGQTIGHSSTTHVGFYDKETKEFMGAEQGAGVSYVIAVNPYDVDQVSEELKSREGKSQEVPL